MSKSLCILLSVIMAIILLPALPITVSAEPPGSAGNPIGISNVADLKLLADKVNGTNAPADAQIGVYYALTADIAFTPADGNFTPIGNTQYTYFNGSFDGAGYTIRNLKVNVTVSSTDNAYAGLFGYIDTQANVSNVKLANASISATNTGGNYSTFTGGIAGYSVGKIDKCSVDGSVTAVGKYVTYAGGIAGFSYGAIEQCYTSAEVAATRTDSGVEGAFAGGIVGRIERLSNSAAILKNCYALGNVTATVSSRTDYNVYAGGIAGYVNAIYGMELSTCYAKGNVTAEGTASLKFAGGIAGRIIYSQGGGAIGKINNGVAINGEIKGSDIVQGHLIKFTSRVALPQHSDAPASLDVILSNNRALDTMTVNSSVPTTEIGQNKQNGISITKAQQYTITTWKTDSQFPDAVWDFSTVPHFGRPVLKNQREPLVVPPPPSPPTPESNQSNTKAESETIVPVPAPDLNAAAPPQPRKEAAPKPSEQPKLLITTSAHEASVYFGINPPYSNASFQQVYGGKSVKLKVKYKNDSANPNSFVLYRPNGTLDIFTEYDGTTVTFNANSYGRYNLTKAEIPQNANVDPDADYYDAFVFCAARGLVSDSGSSFNPEGDTSIGDFAKLLTSMAGESIKSDDGNPASHLDWLKKNNFISSDLDPNAPITTELFCYMLSGMAKVTGKQPPQSNLSGYDDADDVAPWAKAAVARMVNAKVLQGDNLDPQGVVSQADMCVMIKQYIKWVIGK